MRYALYFTPPVGDRLTRLASSWLGRNAFSGKTLEPPVVTGLNAAEIAFHTAAPRRYGFHGTLKAPFSLREGTSEAELLRALMLFCSGLEPFEIPRLEVSRLGSFFALTPCEPHAALDNLAGRIVSEFDHFRAPLSETDIARRNPDKLTSAQIVNLHRWGYPHVFDDFRFHMTLTGRVGAEEGARVETVLRDLFAPVLAQPVTINNIALFVESEKGAPFSVHSLHPLGRVENRKTG